MEQLLARAKEGTAQQAGPGLITAHEAEHLVEALRSYDTDQVGSAGWRGQHGSITQLNLQAHHNAQTHSDEFVKSALVSLDKLPLLIKELLTYEVWKSKVLPSLQKHIAEQVDPMTTYMLLQHEAAIANLLEITLYHQEACEAVEEDSLLELCDWGYRKLVSLNNQQHQQPHAQSHDPKVLLDTSAEEDFQAKMQEANFGTATSALTILRYISDYIDVLPLGIVTRLIKANDTLMALIPLLEDPPWVRRRNKKVEKYIGNVWTAVEPTDRLRLTQHDAQAWLMMNNLLVNPKARAKYDMDNYRKEAVLRVRRYMNEILLDQLPVLKDLQRVLDELTMGVSSQPDESQTGRLIIEQVPLIRTGLLKRNDWQQIADGQRKAFFGHAAMAQQSKSQVDEMLKALDFMCNLQPDQAQHPAGHKSNQTDVKFELWRRVRGDVFERWEEQTCSLNPARPPEPVSIEAEDGTVIHGLRHRLQALEPDVGRPFPANGKIAARYGGQSAEALLELPAPSTKGGAAELAAVVWLTVGLLATDGFALQLKLKRAEQPRTRDKTAGIWYIYYAVGGAITVLQTKTREQL